MLDILDQDIQFLPGVGPRRKTLLEKERGIRTYEDLLEYYPFKYIDRRHIYKISELTPDAASVQICARLLSCEMFDMGFHRLSCATKCTPNRYTIGLLIHFFFLTSQRQAAQIQVAKIIIGLYILQADISVAGICC